ncbi:MAG TPA: hypothetical protein VFE71_01970 [Bacteroidales bacterium]|nr:hypothetical protein [Bacteroidales bacterium]
MKKQESGLKREVTLYNPYKPSLPDSKKRSFLPEISDTSKIRPVFHYDVRTTPFLPEYTISPIKAAALLPDPLPKLYKSYLNLGIGNYLTPLAEISITNERSKNGTIGFYARHFSTNGKMDIENTKKVFAGYMDNDASLFGKRFFRKNILKGSLDFSQKVRHAYGYNPQILDYDPSNKDIRIPYNNFGVKTGLSSINLDSARFSYDYNLSFDYFTAANNMYQRKVSVDGIMSKSFKGFYVGSGINYDYYKIPDFLLAPPKYIFSVSPFVKKSSELWNFKLGLQILLDRNMTTTAMVHVYPDINFGFSLVPTYINFFAGLSGKLEKNEPLKIITENPYVIGDGSLFKIPNTSHDLIVATGFKGNTGIGGNYLLSASYSLISDMIFFTNILSGVEKGNYFLPLTDDVELFNIHGEMNGPISDKLSFISAANYYKYTLSHFAFAWNKPDWDAKIGLKYNLRDKIIAGMEISLEGKRKEIVDGQLPVLFDAAGPFFVDLPAHFNLNLNAEYRYSNILSFWAKLDNISNKRYYEWAFYPTHGFMFMLGFTYSL